jgi:hypothetical protein
MLDLCTQAEAVEALRLSERTPEAMRVMGLGPVFVREKRFEESHRADLRRPSSRSRQRPAGPTAAVTDRVKQIGRLRDRGF